MAVKILIPTPLRHYTGQKDVIELHGSTVREVLDQLVSQHNDLKKHLIGEDGKLRNFVNVYVNEEDIRVLSKEATPVKDGDVLMIVPSIAGGILGTHDWIRI